jgi:hypothetical protein
MDALRAAYASRATASKLLKQIPSVTVWELLGAVLLDTTGLAPSDLLSGTTVLVHDDIDVVNAVHDVLRRVFPDGLLLLKGGSHEDRYDAAVGQGMPVVLVLTDRLAFMPHAAVLLADRDLDIGEVGRPSIVAALTKAVTGTALQISEESAAQFGAATLIRCVPLHVSFNDCARKVRTWLDVPAGKPDEDEGDAAPAPVPVGRVAHDVVRRLSEMTGFGEAQTWGMNLAADLRDYRDGRLAWADVDRGVLLSGPPGGGKTTFARALALECDVPLVVTVYSDWHQGGGDAVARTLTKLFAEWRKQVQDGPFILFIDELDSIGARGGSAHNDSWFRTIVNAWLAFLDGAIPRDGIVVVGATNLPGSIDPALLRPGRLDRHIALPLPDIEAIEGMVRAHLGPDAILTDAEVAEAARALRGRSPAQVQQLAREARRLARWCKRRVCASDLTDAVAMQRLGRPPAQDRHTAVHEAAHAVAAVVVGVDRLVSADVDAGMTTMTMAEHWTQAVIEGRLTMMLAARAAEELVLGAPTTGATKDLEDATVLATGLHARWGFGVRGLVSESADVAVTDVRIREAVRVTLDEAYVRAMDLVTTHRAAIDRVADALVARRYLDAGEVRALVAGPMPVTPPVRRSAPSMAGRVTRTVGPASTRGPT